MSDMVVILMASTVLLGQLSQCMLGSRCSEINTPCCQIKRDTLSEDALNAMREGTKSPRATTSVPGTLQT